MQITPNKVLRDGISLNKKQPGIIDITISEYSNKDTTEGDAMIQAEKIQTKPIEAAIPKNNINFQV